MTASKPMITSSLKVSLQISITIQKNASVTFVAKLSMYDFIVVIFSETNEVPEEYSSSFIIHYLTINEKISVNEALRGLQGNDYGAYKEIYLKDCSFLYTFQVT